VADRGSRTLSPRAGVSAVAAATRDGWRRLRVLGLRRWLMLERDTVRQILKTALAATLSWELAIRLLHSPLPALASLGAILTVQVTVKQTLSVGIQQVVGVTVGVGAAVVVVDLLGVHTWSVGLVILASLVIGNLLRLGAQVNQVAISALLVLALGTGYGSARIVDTLLGAVVGLVVNAVVAPPTHVQSAAVRITRVAEDLGLLLADAGDGLLRSWDRATARDWLRRAREIDDVRHEAGEAVGRGEESLVYNPLARAEAELVARLTEAHIALEHVATQVRSICRSLADLGGSAGCTPEQVAVLRATGQLLRSAGAAVAAFGRLQAEHPPTEARAELVSAHAAAVDAREAVSRALEALPPDESSRILVSIFVDAGRMLHEIDPDNGAHTGAVPPAAS
jgi:Aromatic acid exporter family member 1